MQCNHLTQDEKRGMRAAFWWGGATATREVVGTTRNMLQKISISDVFQRPTALWMVS